MRVVHGAGPDRIDEDADAHAAARGLFQRRGELIGDLAGVVDVGLEADPPLRAADRLEHRGKHLIAVGQHVVVVAARRVGADERRDVGWVPGVPGRGRAANLQREVVLREHEENRDHDRRDGQDRERPADR